MCYRWAKPGFDFLCVACEPRVTVFISEQGFGELKSYMNKCIVHVIGERVHHSLSSPGRPGSPLPDRLQRNVSCPQGIARTVSRASSSYSSASSSATEPHTPQSAQPISDARTSRTVIVNAPPAGSNRLASVVMRMTTTYT